MNTNKKNCPNCSQLYQLKSLSLKKGNIPLLLSCGHSMCQNCINNLVKFNEPIECKVCHNDMEIDARDVALLAKNKIKLHTLFPVNYFVLGELTLQLLELGDDAKEEADNDFFVDLQAIIKSTDRTQGDCIECRNITTKMCQQCATILCDSCFNKTHKNFIVFKNHSLQIIEPQVEFSTCKHHKDKPLDYYCKDCSKAICMDCMMVGGEKSCKNHNVISLEEMNEEFSKNIDDITPKVNDVYKRLTKTAVDIGNLLYSIENNSGASKELTVILSEIENHFSKLFFNIQKHKKGIIDTIVKLKQSEKESLKKAKNDVTAAIKSAKVVLNTIKASADPNKINKVNLCTLLEQAEKVLEMPWHLSRDEKERDPLKVSVNEDLCALMSDYVHLEGNADPTYKLRSTKELGDDAVIPPAPQAPVFPPDLPKDVRQSNVPNVEKNVKATFHKNAPTYRSKSGSNCSLNSSLSDASGNDRITPFNDRNRPLVQPVLPFEESQHPKPIHEGTQELIYISHIVNPHNFFVQRSCHQRLVKNMLREFRNATSLPKPSISHVIEGKLYLAFNKVDDMWQRCRVVSIDRKDINNPLFQVFCIDFGSNENVTIDNLRLLPPARVQSPLPLAINCSLANCEPKSGAWTADDAFLIQRIIDNKQAVIHVRHIRSASNYNVTLECDVTTIEDGVSLAHALVFHEQAKMPNPKLTYPKIVGLIEKPKLYMGNDFKPKAVEEVFLTHIISPDKFFVRKNYLQEVFEKLCEDLDGEMNTNSGLIYLPEIGMVCAVNLEKYSSEVNLSCGWARGIVRELPGRGRVRLSLVDTGATMLVHWKSLRHLPQKFTTLRALAIECHLAGVTAVNKKWSPNSVALLQQFENRLLELHVEDNKNKDSIGVTLYDKEDPDNVICINSEMIRRKFAISFGIFKFDTRSSREEPVFPNRTPLDKKESKPQPKKTLSILKKQPEKLNEEDLEAKDKGPLKLEAKILCYQTPSLFYVSFLHVQKAFNELFENIQKYYSMKKPTNKNWTKGDRCCAFCIQSKTWRRAIILDLEGENAKVFYSDFAFVETIQLSDLRELTPEFAQTGDAAVKCHVSGVIPAVGEEWPSISKEFLKELLDVYKRVFITKLGSLKNKSMPVELWVYHTEQGGALEPNKSEWRCLNKKLIEQGLGIPDKSHEVPCPENKENSEEMLSFLNVTGSVHEWLQLEPMPIKPLLVKSDEETTTTASSPTHEDIATVGPSSKETIFISEWLPPEPLSHKEFTAIPTYIDNEGVIYLHDVQQQETLDLIRKALDTRFKSPDPKAKFAKWTVGEPCIALYYLDNCFYRGKVLQVDYEASSCLIHYIDYGNEEQCSFENMRKSIALYQIPTQAHKCILSRIRPAESNNWDRKTLDYIHKSIVEKNCTVKITGPPIGDVFPIELKYDVLCINDHLVDFEMAVYSDGSKAVVRKFAPIKIKEKIVEEIVFESDSGPDYVVEEESSNTEKFFETHDSFDIVNKDWVQLMDEDKQESNTDNFMKYPNNPDDEFQCNISVINDFKILPLAVELNDESVTVYEHMYQEVQSEGENLKPLNGIYENKACVALFSEDSQWYRASILEYSEAKNQIKVRYVDYGNIEVIDLSDAREITEEWTKLPPATVAAKLYGIEVNPDLHVNEITEAYAETFLDKGPFDAKIMKYVNMLPYVELRRNGELVYEDLIKNGIFLKVPVD